MDILTQLQSLVSTGEDHWASLILSTIGVFSALATIIPAPKDDASKVYRGVYSVISWIACNFGKARNAGNK